MQSGLSIGKIIGSLVTDVIMPPIGILFGGVDFANLSFVLKEATEAAEAVTMNYGVFINTVVEFVIIAFAIFMVIVLRRVESAARAKNGGALKGRWRYLVDSEISITR